MNGKLIYFSIASLLGVLCSLQSFLIFFCLAFVYAIATYKYKRFSNRQFLALIVVFLLFLGSSQLASIHNKTNTPETASLFYLKFIEDPVIDGDLLQIKVQDLKYSEKYLLRYKIQSEQEKNLLESSDFYGQMCKITGALEKPKQAKNENAFNYRQYLKRNSIFWLLNSNKLPLQDCTPTKMNALSYIKQVRLNGIKYLEKHFPSDIAALSTALIYGDRSLMSPELLTYYQKAGLSHLLAISGLHVALLTGMVFYMGIRLGITRESMTRSILILLPVYAVLAGGSPSVVRSVLMIFIVMVTGANSKKRLNLQPFDALSLSFSLFLLVNPFVIFDVGFQLSFCVSAAIILSGQTILQHYQNNVIRLLMTTATAQLSALPIVLFHFFGFSLLSIFINLIFVPLYSYLFLPGVYLLVLVQIMFGIVPSILLNPFEWIVQAASHLTELFSRLSFADFTPGRPQVPFLLIDIVIPFLMFILWEQKKRKSIIILCFLLLLFPFGCKLLNPNGEVSIIDVGQGDSIFIHLPFQRGNYLIDTGGSLPFSAEPWQKRAKTFEIGEDVVVPFLKGKGVTRLDKLILTHGDTDHIGGAFAVIKEIKVKQIVMPDVQEHSDTEKAIIAEAEKRGIQVVLVSTGYKWKPMDSDFVILSPKKNFNGDRNRGSVVVLANVGGVNWFFGGDLDQQGEEEIVKKFPNVDIDVLKVGHHGSKTSSSDIFLKHYKPKVALISAGEKNRFGHPHKEVIEKLTKINATIFRTDIQGEISYHFLNRKGTFFTFLP